MKFWLCLLGFIKEYFNITDPIRIINKNTNTTRIACLELSPFSCFLFCFQLFANESTGKSLKYQLGEHFTLLPQLPPLEVELFQ